MIGVARAYGRELDGLMARTAEFTAFLTARLGGSAADHSDAAPA